MEIYCSKWNALIEYVNIIVGEKTPRIRKIAVCQHEGCIVSASYGYPKDRKRLRCATHRQSDMINLCTMTGLCKHKDCTELAQYNYSGYKRKRFCEQHKKDDMILI